MMNQNDIQLDVVVTIGGSSGGEGAGGAPPKFWKIMIWISDFVKKALSKI